MQASAVEAEIHGQFNIVLEEFVRRAGVDAVGIEALVEYGAHEDRTVVEPDAVFFQFHLAHAEVALHGVAGVEGDGQIVEIALTEIPQMELIEIEHNGCVSVNHSRGCLTYLHAVVIRSCRDGSAADGFHVNNRAVIVHKRRDLRVFDVGFRNKFQPDGLPDAGGSRVGASIGFIPLGLLAVRLLQGTVVVLGIHDDEVLAFLHSLGDVELERGVTAGMLADLLSVDVNDGMVVHSAEVQKNASGNLLRGQLKRAAVPDSCDPVRVADAGETAFGAERNGDFLHVTAHEVVGVPELAVASGVAEVKEKIPLAVEVHPCVTHELRSGMFRSWNSHDCSPF